MIKPLIGKTPFKILMYKNNLYLIQYNKKIKEVLL